MYQFSRFLYIHLAVTKPTSINSYLEECINDCLSYRRNLLHTYFPIPSMIHSCVVIFVGGKDFINTFRQMNLEGETATLPAAPSGLLNHCLEDSGHHLPGRLEASGGASASGPPDHPNAETDSILRNVVYHREGGICYHSLNIAIPSCYHGIGIAIPNTPLK